MCLVFKISGFQEQYGGRIPRTRGSIIHEKYDYLSSQNSKIHVIRIKRKNLFLQKILQTETTLTNHPSQNEVQSMAEYTTYQKVGTGRSAKYKSYSQNEVHFIGKNIK